MTELNADSYHHKQGMLNFEVTIPCIVNNEKITGGAEIVLRWEHRERDDASPPNAKRIRIDDSEPAPKWKK